MAARKGAIKKTQPVRKKPAAPDDLITGGKAELSEDQLKEVSGGGENTIGGAIHKGT